MYYMSLPIVKIISEKEADLLPTSEAMNQDGKEDMSPPSATDSRGSVEDFEAVEEHPDPANVKQAFVFSTAIILSIAVFVRFLIDYLYVPDSM